MEEKRDRDASQKYSSFMSLLEAARNGDQTAMEELLQFFDSDFEYLAKFIRIPREDALQALKTEFIEMVRNR